MSVNDDNVPLDLVPSDPVTVSLGIPNVPGNATPTFTLAVDSDDDLNPWWPIGILAGAVLLMLLLCAIHKSRAAKKSQPKFKDFRQNLQAEGLDGELLMRSSTPGAAPSPPAKTATSSLGYVL